MANIRKGDLVEVISGSRDQRGKQGKVLEVLVGDADPHVILDRLHDLDDVE